MSKDQTRNLLDFWLSEVPGQKVVTQLSHIHYCTLGNHCLVNKLHATKCKTRVADHRKRRSFLSGFRKLWFVDHCLNTFLCHKIISPTEVPWIEQNGFENLGWFQFPGFVNKFSASSEPSYSMCSAWKNVCEWVQAFLVYLTKTTMPSRFTFAISFH